MKELPLGLVDGLPEEDQRAITAIVGVPIRFRGFDEDGRMELEFVEGNGTGHAIFVDRRFVKPAKPAAKKPTKRRK